VRTTSERIVPEKTGHPLFADHLIRYMFCKQFVNDKVVLDDGCGCGYGSLYLAENSARMVVGIDVSRDAINYAKTHFLKKNIKFKVVDGANLPFSNDSFDVVVSIEVIEHIHNYEQYLSEISRVLKPSGILVISTPNKKVSSPGLKKPQVSFHVKEFYPDEFKKQLELHFKEVKIFGKRVINESFLFEENRIIADRRIRFGMFLPREIRRLTPLWIKQLLLPKNSVTLSLDDFEISERDIERASNMIAVCKK
jgi:ubiquinone/menaquinone biosynthesis C-methylase UbiE